MPCVEDLLTNVLRHDLIRRYLELEDNILLSEEFEIFIFNPRIPRIKRCR